MEKQTEARPHRAKLYVKFRYRFLFPEQQEGNEELNDE